MKNCFPILATLVVLAGTASAESALTARSIVRADSRSGRLVRSVVVQPKVVTPKLVQPITVDDKAAAQPKRPAETLPPDADIQDLIDHAALKYNVDPNLVHAVVKVESNYNQFAVSHAGAEGLMQLIPSTARRFGVNNSFDARQNIEAGVRYLKYLQTLYGSNMRLALAAYNAGEGAVTRYQGIPRYRETENYLVQVGRRWGELNRSRKPAAAPKYVEPASQPPAATAEPEHRPLETVIDADGKIHLRTR
jgi:soluble lytic murein transglycosylase-like protein